MCFGVAGVAGSALLIVILILAFAFALGAAAGAAAGASAGGGLVGFGGSAGIAAPDEALALALGRSGFILIILFAGVGGGFGGFVGLGISTRSGSGSLFFFGLPHPLSARSWCCWSRGEILVLANSGQ